MAKKVSNQPAKRNIDVDKAEDQIEELRKVVDFDIKEYPIEVIVEKFTKKEEGTQRTEFFIPDYQRDFAWDEKRQSKFIESVLLGLPIPFLTLADVGSADEDGSLEIVDGSQRVRTLTAFMQNELKLCKLPKLTELEGFSYDELSILRKRRFRRSTIRIIVLTEKADEETRRDIFERINTGSVDLSNMEKRIGIQPGPFVDFVRDFTKDEIFQRVITFTPTKTKREEPAEYVLRFFAYAKNYQNYKKYNDRVREFLDDYVKGMNDELKKKKKPSHEKSIAELAAEFRSVLEFVEKYFPFGFRKTAGAVSIPRIRFEAIAVGVALALRENPKIKPTKKMITQMLESDEFMYLTTSDGSNNTVKVVGRIDFVRDFLLGRETHVKIPKKFAGA